VETDEASLKFTYLQLSAE